MRAAHRFGVDSVQPPVDLGRVMDSVQQAVDRVHMHETAEALGARSVDVFLGMAKFDDPHTILVGERQELRGRHVLLCPGAEPAVPDIPGLESVAYWTYQTIWRQRQLPTRLLIIGSGPVGIEFAQGFARLGSTVTVFDRGDRPLRVAHPEASAILRKVLEREGVRFVFGARLQEVRATGATVSVRDRGQDIEGDALLVAAGRRPRLEGLGLERAGVAYTTRGIQVDAQLWTTRPHIFACGDVVRGFQFTHYAAWQASRAIRTMLFPGSSVGLRSSVPSTIFTDPEVAQCGLTETEARSRFRRSRDVRVTRLPLFDVDRAVAEQDVDGFIKLVHRDNGELLGAQIVAARAGDMLGEIALALERGLKLRDLADALHVYPTYALGIQQLAAEVATQSRTQSRIVRLARRLNRFLSWR
jgi:pyruvate/2-oxoglutarate dehydrogenase complex dihydrolipoamide dehydrogenase (E3) component